MAVVQHVAIHGCPAQCPLLLRPVNLKNDRHGRYSDSRGLDDAKRSAAWAFPTFMARVIRGDQAGLESAVIFKPEQNQSARVISLGIKLGIINFVPRDLG